MWDFDVCMDSIFHDLRWKWALKDSCLGNHRPLSGWRRELSSHVENFCWTLFGSPLECSWLSRFIHIISLTLCQFLSKLQGWTTIAIVEQTILKSLSECHYHCRQILVFPFMLSPCTMLLEYLFFALLQITLTAVFQVVLSCLDLVFNFLVKSVDVLPFELKGMSDDEKNGSSYLYVTWYTYFEPEYSQSNTVSSCTNVEYSIVISSKLSINVIVRSLRYILNRYVSDYLLTSCTGWSVDDLQ